MALALACTACYKPESAIGPSTMDDVLRLNVSPASLMADGRSRATITAMLDPRTDADKRDVSFTTTAGTLVAGGSRGASVTVRADDVGRAVAELESPLTPITAQVEAKAGPFVQTAAVTFRPLARELVLAGSATPPSIPADGFSKSVVAATLKLIGTLQQRAVRFETSAGTLITAGGERGGAVVTAADSEGIATVELQSEKVAGSARVRITALELSEEVTVTFTPVEPSHIITLSTDRSSVAADGVTPVTLRATVASGLPAARRRVTFYTTLGQAVPPAGDADSNNVVRASLISATTGTARVSATVDGSTAETSVQFVPALPEKLHVSASHSTLSPGSNAVVRATLLRTNGNVSPHIVITWSAVTAAGVAIGSFSGVTLAENAIATAIFNLGATTYVGPVTIKATAEGGATGTTSLNVVP